MKHVAAVRRKIGTPTIFNILGPLVNPASAEFQLLGVGKAGLQSLLAEAMLLLNSAEQGVRTVSAVAPRTIVVHGFDGLDEVTLSGPTHVIEAAGGRLTHYDWTPGDFGLETSSKDLLLVHDATESAAVIRAILDGQRGPARDIVLANASAGLFAAGRVSNLRDGVQLAAEAIDSGKAARTLARLADLCR
jgi:anthranilate phosphoribosyltransferase